MNRKTWRSISAVKKLALLKAESYRKAAMEAMTKRALRYRPRSKKGRKMVRASHQREWVGSIRDKGGSVYEEEMITVRWRREDRG